MILLPFFNCFLLYICLVDKQILSKPYTYLLEKYGHRIPTYLQKTLGQCVICTAFWMGIIELLIVRPDLDYKLLILTIAYNAIATHILFNLSTLHEGN